MAAVKSVAYSKHI